MKKIAAALAFVCVIAAGCGETQAEQVKKESRLSAIDGFQYYTIIVDKETGIQYLCNYHGGITIMIDADGKPLIWEGAK